MDRPSLIGCRKKMERAQTHFKALATDFAAKFKEGEMYEEVRKFDPETRWLSYEIRMLKQPPVIDWGILAGEVIHQFRSTLDHLVWQLVLLNGKKPKRSNEFPVAFTETQFRNEASSKLKGVRPTHRAVIRAAQPFCAGYKPSIHPLATLHSFWLDEKHRHIPVAAAAVGSPIIPMPIAWFTDFPPPYETRAPLGRLEEGTEIAAIRIPTGFGEDSAEMQAHYARDIQLGEGAISFPKMIQESSVYIDGLLDVFEPHFPKEVS